MSRQKLYLLFFFQLLEYSEGLALVLVELEGVDDDQDHNGDGHDPAEGAEEAHSPTNFGLGVEVSKAHSGHGDDNQPESIGVVFELGLARDIAPLADPVGEGEDHYADEEDEGDELDGALLEVALDQVQVGVGAAVDFAHARRPGVLELEHVHYAGDKQVQLEQGADDQHVVEFEIDVVQLFQVVVIDLEILNHVVGLDQDNQDIHD